MPEKGPQQRDRLGAVPSISNNEVAGSAQMQETADFPVDSQQAAARFEELQMKSSA
jgi:hypothetical protein